MNVEDFTEIFSQLDFLCLTMPRKTAENFLSFVFGLILASENSINRMADLFDGELHQSTLNRFLTTCSISTAKLLECYRNWLASLPTSTEPIYCIIDDSTLHKSGKLLPGAHYDYDHTNNAVCWGQKVVICLLKSAGKEFPFGIELYEKFAKNFRSKIDWANELIADVLKYFPTGNIIVLFDSWYCCIKLIEKLPAGIGWVSKLRRNRLIRVGVGGHWMPLKEFIRGVKSWEYRKATVDGKAYWCYETLAEVKNLGTVKLVLTKISRHARRVSAVLVTNMTDKRMGELICHFSQRWCIETCIRTAKQSLGFESCMVRSKKALRRYWFLLMLAYALLSHLKKSVISKAKTLGDVISYLKKSFSKLREGFFYLIKYHVSEIFAKA